MGKIKKIGVLTSGGDAPGMNAAIRGAFAAVEALLDDQKSIMVGFHNNEIAHIPFNKVIKLKKTVNPEELAMVEILSV